MEPQLMPGATTQGAQANRAPLLARELMAGCRGGFAGRIAVWEPAVDDALCCRQRIRALKLHNPKRHIHLHVWRTVLCRAPKRARARGR